MRNGMKNKKDNLLGEEVNNLLGKANPAQLKNFLFKELIKNHELRDGLAIFLEGPKETPVTLADYKAKFKNELDCLDLDELLQAWYHSDDYYNYYDYSSDGYDSEVIENIADNIIAEAEKYADNQNFAEALKISQAGAEALIQKESELQDDYKEFSDWFLTATQKILNFYAEILTNVSDIKLKEDGLKYLVNLFEGLPCNLDQGDVLDNLRLVIGSQKESAQAVLDFLKVLKDKEDLSCPESALLSQLYVINRSFDLYEQTVRKNLSRNPGLTVDLLKYLKKEERKGELVVVANEVLSRLREKPAADTWHRYDFKSYRDITIDVRRFLNGIYDIRSEYKDAIGNMEELFLNSADLSDYQKLAKAYNTTEEKENFWSIIKKQFTQRNNIEALYKVFLDEDQKAEILFLVQRYTETRFFPEMVASISAEYPKECFATYKNKVETLLIPTKVELYSHVAYHLKQMKLIGLAKDFDNFLIWIKTTYYRRRRLMEEIASV